MTHLFATKALLPDGWNDDVRLRIDQGHIRGIEVAAKPSADDTLAGCVIPGSVQCAQPRISAGAGRTYRAAISRRSRQFLDLAQAHV